MQINKKLSTIAITALLLLSILAVVAPAFAVTATAPVPAIGIVGSKTLITVTDASAGGQLMVYWQNVVGIVLSNSTTYADGVGAGNIVVTIPDAAAGTYSIIVKDVSTGNTVGATGGFTVTPSISLSSTRGIPGDSVTVTGTGFGASKNINVTFNAVDVTPAALQVSSATGNFSLVFKVPTVAYGTYNVVASDNSTVPNVSPAVSFIVGAAVTILPTSGPAGTIVTATGKGFTNTVGLTVTITIGGVEAKNVTLIKTLADGTFSGQFVVPSSLAVSSSRYTVTASDGTITGSTSGTGSFKVTGTTGITLTPTSGPPGTTITVVGVNFTAIADTAVTLKFNVITVGTFTTDASGGFSGTFTVPSLPTATYTVTATDANLLTGSKSFTIAILSLYLSPTSGPTGTVITVTGFGFGITGGTTANVTIGATRLGPDVTVAALTTSTTFIIPTLPVGAYTVKATDNTGLTASATFTVTQTTTLTVNPITAPVTLPGVTLTAKYFSASVPITFTLLNSTYSTVLTVSPAGITNSSGAYVGTFTVPTLALGSYTINATDANGLNTTTTFNIGVATFIINTRASAYLQGETVSFDIRSTFADNLNVYIADPTGYPATLYIWGGEFVPMGDLMVLPYNYGVYGFPSSGWLSLPSDAVLGTWTWNATLGGITKTGSFKVNPSANAVITAINQTVTQTNSTVNTINTNLDLVGANITSISGNVVTLTTKVGQVTTTLDAIGANITSIKGTVVTIQTNLGQVQTSLTAINALVVAINGNTATLSTTMGTVTASVNSLGASISGISSGVATIQTNLGTVTAKLSSIDAVIGYVAGDTTTLKTSVGTIATSLASINTTVTSIEGNVATIKTDLGTLTGTVTSISNGVATIQTGIGTLQANVGNLQTEVTSTQSNTSGLSTLIYVAIVLALIAAIAAVFCIIIVRQKIAG